LNNRGDSATLGAVLFYENRPSFHFRDGNLGLWGPKGPTKGPGRRREDWEKVCCFPPILGAENAM